MFNFARIRQNTIEKIPTNFSDIYANNVSRFVERHSKAQSSLSSSSDFLYVDQRGDQPVELGLVTAMHDYVITQIGEYGPEFSEKLLRTTQIMRTLLEHDETLKTQSAHIAKDGGRFLTNETARMMSTIEEGATKDLAPLSSTLEGLMSLHQLFSNVLAKKVPGDDDGAQALHDLIFNSRKPSGLVSELTSRHVMGVVGPMALSGLHFQKAFVREADGKLSLSPELTKVFEQLAEKSPVKSRCPMAGLWKKGDSKTGLQDLAEAYWKVFTVVDRMYEAGER